ncbi:MAG: AI-2E family transporter [Fimbriimonadaceae bacterium]|jgi:predicted PurR-regulated permease PerM|nr:AI-2E family transporter [Fimbriimonadaceae bacterium]
MTDIGKDSSRLIFWGVFVLIMVLVAVMLYPFVPAISWAAVFAVLTAPLYQRFLSMGWKPAIAALACVGVVSAVFVVPIGTGVAIAGAQLTGQVQELVQTKATGPEIEDRLAAEVDRVFQPLLDSVGANNVKVSKLITENRNDLGQRLAPALTNGFRSVAVGALTIVIALLTMFFMLTDGKKLLAPVCEMMPIPQDETVAIINRIGQTIRSVFYGVIAVSVIQGLLAGLAYFVAGVPGALPLMFLTMFLCTIPLLGAPFIYVPVSLYLLATGNVPQAIGVALWGFIVVSNIDNILRPLYIGQNAKLHYMAVFFSLLGGVLLIGPIGIMVGPVILTVALALLDVVRTRRRLLDGTGDPEPEPA